MFPGLRITRQRVIPGRLSRVRERSSALQYSERTERGAGFRVWPIDYAVVDEARIGRICREPVPGVMKWRLFPQTVPAPPPNSGMADTLDEAKATFAKRYAEITTQRVKR